AGTRIFVCLMPAVFRAFTVRNLGMMGATTYAAPHHTPQLSLTLGPCRLGTGTARDRRTHERNRRSQPGTRPSRAESFFVMSNGDLRDGHCTPPPAHSKPDTRQKPISLGTHSRCIWTPQPSDV